jgi:DNA mismatch endonuclease, patch repair protein
MADVEGTATPKASSADALRRMQRQRRRDTAPELALRSLLHRRGLRFRVDHKLPNLRRRADLVFARARVAVFIDGCFWHGCPEHGTWPRANAEWWKEKIQANRERDIDTDRSLRDAGWAAVRLWEHEDPETAARLVETVVRSRLAHT